MSDEKFYVILDEKVTTWVRHKIQVKHCACYNEAVEKVIQAINSNMGIYCADTDVCPMDSEELCDTEEPMTVSENGGFDTLEILDKNYQVTWDNVNGYAENNKS